MCNLRLFILAFFVIRDSIVSGYNYEKTAHLLDPEVKYYESAIYSVDCVIRLCEKYFRSERKVKGSIVIVNIRPQNPSRFQTKILELLNENIRHEYGVMVKDARSPHGNPVHVSEKARNYLMLIHVWTEGAAIVEQWRSLPTWNPSAQTIVLFLDNKAPEDLELHTTEVLSLLFDNFLLNVNVISTIWNTSKVQVQTWYPYEYDNCATQVENFRPVDECEYVITSNGDEENAYEERNETAEAFNLFKKNFYHEIHYHANIGPKIPLDFHQCPLKISAGRWEPFVLFDDDTEMFTSGIEVYMLETIADRLNMELMFSKITQTRANAVYNDSLTLYSDLVMRFTDMMVGGLDEDPNTRRMLSASIPYYQDDLTWCVQKAGLIPKWLNIFALFTLEIWIIIIALVFLTAYIFKQFALWDNYPANLFWANLGTLSLTMALSFSYTPHRSSFRIFFISFLAYGMILATSYQSFLISVLTRPRYQHQVQSIEHAIRNEYKLAGGVAALSHYTKNDEISNYVRANYRICESIDDCLNELYYDNHLAVSVSRKHAMNSPTINRFNIFCFARANNIYTFSVSMITKRDFHLLPRINALVRKILEYGFLGKWEQMSSKVESYIEKKSSTQIVLTFSHVQGGFIIFGIGLTLASIFFTLEILTHCNARVENCRKFWKIMERILSTVYPDEILLNELKTTRNRLKST